jgi:outer membrane protein
MKRMIVALMGLMAIGASTRAQQVTPLTLQQCMDYAVKNNYTIKNAQLDVLIQRAQVAEQLSAAYPHINAKAEMDDYIVPQRTYFPTGSFSAFLPAGSLPVGLPEYSAIQITPQYSGTASVSLTQPLFDGGILVALQARNAVILSAIQQGEVTEETVRYNVFKAYNSLVIAYRQLDLTAGLLKYNRSLQHDIEVTRANGMAEKIDVERASVQVTNLVSDSIRTSNLLTTSEQVLKYQMGMDINTPIVLVDTNIASRRDGVLKLMTEEKNYDRVPEYNLYNTQLMLNQYNVKRYQYAGYPTVNFIANGGYNYSSPHFSDFGDINNYLAYTLLGLQVNMPIFNGLMRKNQVREAKINVLKSENNIAYIKQTIDYQAASARISMKNAFLQVQSQDQNLTLSNDVLDLAQKKYKAGVGSNVEVSQAQSDLLQAQRNYFNTLLDLINAEADLKKALGLLK